MLIQRKIPLVFILLFVVGSVTVGNALAFSAFNENIVSVRDDSHSIIKAETSAGSAIFRMNDVGTKIFDIQVLDGKARMDFVDRSLNAPRLTVTSDGNIGVGTTIPSAKLEVVDDTAAEIKVRSKAGPATINAEATGGDASIILKDAGVGSFTIKMPDGTGDLLVQNGGNTRMSFDSNGDVCLGTCI